MIPQIEINSYIFLPVQNRNDKGYQKFHVAGRNKNRRFSKSTIFSERLPQIEKRVVNVKSSFNVGFPTMIA
jgi:hypothetical protein